MATKKGFNDALSSFRWRNVEEEMPPIRVEVLVRDIGDNTYLKTFAPKSLEEYVKYMGVTHWMPIPEIN